MGEGLELGHRDLVLLRQFADHHIFFSYAALECWAEGEIKRDELEPVLGDLDLLSRMGLVYHEDAEQGATVVGVEGELDGLGPSVEGPTALVPQQSRPQEQTSPLLTVYGGGAQGGRFSGGAWDEDELQKESVTLLDGESSIELIEAFRHLFRAAPNGQARAAVVATALSRHRAELDQEVAVKLEDIAPSFGQAMRRVFVAEPSKASQALQFLLRTEVEEEPPSWSGFWSQIRPTILESLAKSERGGEILIQSVDVLAAVASGEQFLNHQLLDAFLARLDDLSPPQQDKLIQFVVQWAVHSVSAQEMLESRLQLTREQNQRLLLGECLRQTLEERGDEAGLQELANVFVREALSAGSTAGSLALAKLLQAFGTFVLPETVKASSDLCHLTERQILNLVDIWESLWEQGGEFREKVIQLYLQALDHPSEHLSLLLKSNLLQKPPVQEAFKDWFGGLETSRRRQVLSVGYTWSLSVDNRTLLAHLLSLFEWDFESLWEGEWRRPQLSFQRLGWLALCAARESVTFPQDLKDLISSHLKSPPTQAYFWNLMEACAGFPGFDMTLRAELMKAATKVFCLLEPHQEEEREALFEVAAAVVKEHPEGKVFMHDWARRFKESGARDVWWLSGALKAIYSDSEQAPEPERELVSALIHRLMSGGQKSMQDMLARALAATEEEEEQPETYLTLEISNLAYEALAAMACHPSCPGNLRSLMQRRLVLFLISWANQLARTDDPYAYRETPLFGILQEYLEEESEALEPLLLEVSQLFLELHRKVPAKLRLEVRRTAQEFFRAWADHNQERPEAKAWERVLEMIQGE